MKDYLRLLYWNHLIRTYIFFFPLYHDSKTCFFFSPMFLRILTWNSFSLTTNNWKEGSTWIRFGPDLLVDSQFLHSLTRFVLFTYQNSVFKKKMLSLNYICNLVFYFFHLTFYCIIEILYVIKLLKHDTENKIFNGYILFFLYKYATIWVTISLLLDI